MRCRRGAAEQVGKRVVWNGGSCTRTCADLHLQQVRANLQLVAAAQGRFPAIFHRVAVHQNGIRAARDHREATRAEYHLGVYP